MLENAVFRLVETYFISTVLKEFLVTSDLTSVPIGFLFQSHFCFHMCPLWFICLI